MAGLIGMAQTLAVYHYGYYTLKDRNVQFHEPKHVGRGMGSPIPCVQQGEVDPRGSGGTLNWA